MNMRRDGVHVPKKEFMFLSFSLPKPDDLPDHDAEATVDIPHEKVGYLKVAYDLLQEPIK
ncbi:hypothetical protein RND71_024398 [Anisodus tanguticus]|uniref:Uncharacterized protein n=1 Tax=Anisodus tanguticus TaxID=243964 RepID=A0AAE1RR09_9SOLA|nr:hypothetical protein RND71_024398 [Anisodus tanguticus]